MKDVQYIEVRLHIRGLDKDGYGVATMAVPSSAIRWESDAPREDLRVEDVYNVVVEISEHSDRKNHQVIERDLD